MPDAPLKSTDVDALRERIVVSLRATLRPMLAARTREDLYALAVTTDSDVITLRLVAHTEEALAALLEREGGAAGVEGDDADYYRWWPDEWAEWDSGSDDGVTPDDGAESTGDLCDALYEAHAALGDDPALHDQWCTELRAVLDSALGDPRVRAAIAQLNPAWHPVLFVTDTDGDMRDTVHSVDVLNAAHPNPSLVASARHYFDQEV